MVHTVPLLRLDAWQEKERVSPMANEDFSTVRDAKTEALCALISQASRKEIATVLVVGCGDGREAQVIADYFKAQGVAIDIGIPQQFVGRTQFVQMNAEQMAFRDGCFDLVFSFHALEHMLNPAAALAEMARVAKVGATFCVGTPNSRRWVGYIGSPTDWRTKLAWNWIDWKAMATGRFRNELGAHAGFGRRELTAMCQTAFGTGDDITDAYYNRLYGPEARSLTTLRALGLAERFLPSVYVVGTVARAA
ncbi:MAG: class I SAM-dependent methyltransferase [Alphaproteobacteria bacterium]|nr:MAG: class I SAM-dependent methyltransferase [Alphaproteobacteria bacterium]